MSHPRFPLLKLPLELRQQIYNFILPYTTILNSSAAGAANQQILWIRRSLAILQVCRQVYEECVDTLYNTNVFVIDVRFDSVLFRLTWLTAKNLKPKRLYDFPGPFSPENVGRIKNFLIRVEHVDSYQGTIKYNCGGPMLTAGVKDRVSQFVDAVATAQSLGSVSVHLADGNNVLKDIRKVKVHCAERTKHVPSTQVVLEPFRSLRATYVNFSGSITEDYAALLKSVMQADLRPEPNLQTCKGPDIDPAVLWRWKHNWNA